MNMKKRIVAATICLCVIVLALQPVFAGRLSSLFWNDEAWYRDTMSPLLVREGEYFIPTGLLEMFDYITVGTPKDGNLLIYNSENENYISVLTEDGTAAVDGEIVSCAVFREAGTYYIGADLACSALGVRYDTYTNVDGTAVLRVYDSMAMYPFVMTNIVNSSMPLTVTLHRLRGVSFSLTKSMLLAVKEALVLVAATMNVNKHSINF